jgi:tetratricopeptide (TPR) repeat protein
MFVLAGGGWAWASSRRAEQVAARTRDVNDAVAEANLHQGQARASAVEDLAPWTRAAGAGKRAEVLLAGGAVDPATRAQTEAFLVALADESRAAEGRTASARAERRLAERLAAIRDESNIHMDLRRRTADVSSALRDYGVDIATLGPAEAGRRVAASPHADEVVDELDESILWLSWQRGSGDVEWERRFLAVAEAADRDPWRREVRAASARGDVTALKKLSERLDFDRATARGILNLAAALTGKAEYPRALELLQALQRRHPDDYWVNFNLALALINRPDINRFAEASRYAAVAVALRPDAVSGHCLLGNLVRREDALPELREALRINPRLDIAQLVLGKHLLEMGRLDEAVAAERTSVEVAPVLQLAHGLLGTGLRRQGQYDEAKAAFAKAAGLRPVPGFNWPYPLDRLSDECDRMKALAPRFERLMSGEERLSSNPERLALARLSADRGRHAAAVRLWSEAFATEPVLAEDTATWLRFSAASSALLVGLGEAKDEPPPDEGGRSKSLRLALDWLKADVAAYARRAAEGEPRERAAAYNALDYWFYGPGVMRLYFPEDLARLPRPDRDDWRALWDDVLAAQVKALRH